MVNGVVLTGGSTKKGLYFEVVNTIFKVRAHNNTATIDHNVSACVIIEVSSVNTINHTTVKICHTQTVLKRNDARDHFPLLAVCLGFELLAMIVSKVIKLPSRLLQIVYFLCLTISPFLLLLIRTTSPLLTTSIYNRTKTSWRKLVAERKLQRCNS